MRKYILLLVILSSLLLNAKHLEFVGVPINGSISSFSTKLKSKGYTPLQGNNQLPVGIRGFSGVFAGEECELYVDYNPTTKIVYQCKVLINCNYSIETAENKFDYFKELLNKKYGDVALTSDMMTDVESDGTQYSLMIFEPPIEVGANLIGGIGVKICEPGAVSDTYELVISYSDYANYSKNKQNNLDDL